MAQLEACDKPSAQTKIKGMADFFYGRPAWVLSQNSNLTLERATSAGQGGVQTQDAANFVLEQFPNGISRHGRFYLIERTLITGSTAHRIPGKSETAEGLVWYEPTIELVVELVRRIEFSQCPSRFESFFAWETLDDAKKERSFRRWGMSKIYRVTAKSGHRADMNLLVLGNSTISKAWSNAREYWSGRSSDNPSWEHLLSLPVTVLDEVA